MPTQRKPSIVFVHGLWADGSCFSKLIPTLQTEGFEVIASQHGLDSHAEDVANVKRTLGRVSQPAILVGHSYGGSVITAAGTSSPRKTIQFSPSYNASYRNAWVLRRSRPLAAMYPCCLNRSLYWM